MTAGTPFGAATLDAVAPAFQVGGTPVPNSAIAVGGAALIAVLIGISAFFSSSEIAMFSLPAHRVDALVEDGVPGSETLAALKGDPHRLLVTILVGNNLVNIAMSSLATGLLVVLGFGQGQAVTVATFGITALVLLFGESAPKSYAVENTESWALRIAKPLKLAEYVLLPLVLLFDYLTRVVNKVTGGRSAIETSYVTREEIQNIIETGEREGVLDEEEREMLQRTLRFNDTIAKEVMTPRLDMTAVPKTASVEEALETCIQSGHTHLPVYERSLDNVVGIVHVHDLVGGRTDGGDRGGSEPLSDLVEPVLHVPESKNVDDLLTEMRKERIHVVIVIDEFGTTEGLLTIEDLTEEIVGEILEGEEREPIEFVDDDTVVVKGEVNVNEVNEALGIDLPEGEEFETVAGSLFNRAGRLVEEGETFAFDGVEIGVERVENTRITRARLRRVDDGDDADTAESAAEVGSESNAS
ncbi:hemolysin family protein [Haloarcula salina]|uniref:Hemolysin family protein n=1 Tax=Haloarcula salina TaxID=1429914 RepID=A0AA41KLU1_9EURY|nr:hemolysin family protein [Haloarcula salina]MBV0903249.1 hemolysin family protein [Haloarcula salina]